MPRRRGSKPFDLSILRELMRDEREWIALGQVFLFPKETTHWEIVADDAGRKDVFVDVKLIPRGEPLLCRLGAAVGGPGWGVWAIPPVGTEVVIAFPQGELAAHPTIVRTLPTRAVPDGLNESRILICAPTGGQVLVYDGTASEAKPLATKADVDDLANYVAQQFDPVSGHKHGSACTAGGATTASVSPVGTGVPAAAGTGVLFAK